MCFSATASYTASAVLMLCGIISLRRATTKQRMFATIPLLFSLQQFLEGIIWKTIHQSTDYPFAVYGFLSFVFIIWPLWIPFSLKKLPIGPHEKKQLVIPIAAAILLASSAIVCFFTQPLNVAIYHNHLRYSSFLPNWLWIPGTICYLTATVLPFFIVRIGFLRMIGIILFISYCLTLLFFYQTVLSVWCFFAATISICIILFVGKR